MSDLFANLREQLNRAWESPESFKDLIDWVLTWSEKEEEKNMALAYMFAHLFGTPSPQHWFKLRHAWRHTFGHPDHYHWHSDPLNTPNRKRLEIKCLKAISTWPIEYRVFSRFKPEHPMWSEARTLCLLHFLGWKDENLLRCQHFERMILRRDILITDDFMKRLAQLKNVHTLECRLSKMTSLVNVSPFEGLKTLNIGHNYALKSLNGIKLSEKLEEINAEGCSALEQIEELRTLKHLSRLNLTGCTALSKKPLQTHMTTRREGVEYLSHF
jgi:hypothetical protein